MRLSTTFLALSLSLSTIAGAYSIQEDNSVFARYEYEPSDLYIRGGVLSKLSGGEKSKKGKAPEYKHAHRDPPPRYEPSHHHPPPFDGEWDPNQSDYSHNHKSPATGGGRHGGGHGGHRRDYADIEDYLMRRGGMLSKLSGGEKSKKGKAPDYRHAHHDPPPHYEPSHRHPPPFDGEWDPNQSDYSHNHKSPATGGGRHGGGHGGHRRDYIDIEDYLMRRGGMMSKLTGGEKSKKGKAPAYKHAHRDPPPHYEPSHRHPPPFDGEWDPNQSDYSRNHKSPASGGGRHGSHSGH